MREKIIAAGFRFFQASRLDRLLAPLTRGLGAILMFHHVRPARDLGSGFAPNRLLEITPEFLDAVIAALRRLEFDIISLDGVYRRLTEPADDRQRPFAVLTFDDGYRDNRDFALPILRRHGAPFTLFVATGFADRTARLWWRELELSIARARAVEIAIGADNLRLPTAIDEEKRRAFDLLYWRLRQGPEEMLLDKVGALARQNGIDGSALVAEECMDFGELAEVAGEPLCTMGAHTISHAMLAKHDESRVRAELGESRARLAERLGRAIDHVAYPVGDPTSAGAREFAIARELGFLTGATTRPGMIFPGHAAHLTALPRLSINGRWQDIAYVETLLSGAPFALWNGGRRLNVA